MSMNKIDISLIKPYPKNAKKHPKKQIQQVANSIKEFGFNQPIVIDKNNVVIVGHGRLEASKLLGLKEVPVLQIDLDEKKANAYRLADNKLNESEWDMELVIEELKGLDEELVELTGFDLDILNNKENFDNPEIEFSDELLLEHNYIILYFDNILDWNVAIEKFGLKRVKTIAPGNAQKIGIGRVIKGKEFLERI